MENKSVDKKIESQNIDNRQSKKFKITFSNALVVLVGVAMLSVIIYGIIISTSTQPTDTAIPNQLNNQLTQSTKQTVNSGDGYIVYKVDGQYFLEIDDGSKVKDIKALIKSLDLPTDTEVINPAAGYARPITLPQAQPELEDSNLDPINPTQPAQPAVVPNE